MIAKKAIQNAVSCVNSIIGYCTVNHQLIIDLLPAYALDCLSPDEREQVRQHLETCTSCQTELRTFQGVTGQLAAAVMQRTPPPALKERVMREAAGLSGFMPHTNHVPREVWWKKLDRGWPLSGPVFQWVTLFLVLVLAGGNLFLWQKLSQSRSGLGQDFKSVELSGTTFAPGAGGIFVISSDGSFGTLITDGMPPLKEDQAYQLWLVRDGKRTNGGVFTVKPNGYGTLVVRTSRSLLDFTSLGITIEPASGSPAPTGEKVLGGNL
jgi:anti-sigma-K factor RskA